MNGKDEAIENIGLECVQFTLDCSVCGCRSTTFSSPTIDIDEITGAATVNDDALYDTAIAKGWAHTEDGSWLCDNMSAPTFQCQQEEVE